MEFQGPAAIITILALCTSSYLLCYGLISVNTTFVYYSQFTNSASKLQTEGKVSNVVTHPKNKTIRILQWTHLYKGKDWYGLGQKPFKGCLYDNCETVKDKKLYESSDAILVFIRAVNTPLDLPATRRTNQTWIMFNRESPPHTRDGGIFNSLLTFL
jgi:hypothetical protein